MSFLTKLKKVINTGQARVIILTGNIGDLFYAGQSKKWVPLMELISEECSVEPTQSTRGITQLLYKLNNPVECRGDLSELTRMWNYTTGRKNENDKSFTERIGETNRNTTFALEFMRQLCECNRRYRSSKNNLLLMLEATDMLIPEEEVSKMSIADRHRVGIMHDWFSDPKFVDGGDTVILFAESRSKIHHRIARLPQVVSIEVPLPDQAQRWAYTKQFGVSGENISAMSSGLSIHALRQFLKSGDHSHDALTAQVEDYMISQLGEGVIEFKRPSHTLKDVVGASRVKKFMENELIPGFLDGSIGGAAVGGPIGGGKTFICEAVAAELGIPVITLKSIRSKWFGETDAIFERLQRLLKTFHRVVIFVDEADTQFGSVSEGHATERRLTGKIQGMMSDPQLRGKVIWFLMTARIHLLSPDIRRPGRMDLIIPILDPRNADRNEFLEWCFKGVELPEGVLLRDHVEINELTRGYSAASFAMLRAKLKGRTLDEALTLARDIVLPDIKATREYQALQAKVNCTRMSLVVDDIDRKTYDKKRESWGKSIKAMETQGIG